MGKREVLAAYAHTAWSDYMRYLFVNCGAESTGDIVITAAYADALRRLINTPYELLTEEEKESDRLEADKILACL